MILLFWFFLGFSTELFPFFFWVCIIAGANSLTYVQYMAMAVEIAGFMLSLVCSKYIMYWAASWVVSKFVNWVH